MNRRIAFAIEELPGGGFVLLNSEGNAERAFTTLKEAMEQMQVSVRDTFAGADPERMAARLAPRKPPEIRTEKLSDDDFDFPIDEKRGFLGRLVGRA